MRLEQSIQVDASREDVWRVVSDPARYPDFMHGVTRWEHAGGRKTGAGARYSVRMHVGNAYVGGVIEIVEFNKPVELAWVSITGIDQRGRWRLRERDQGGTDVTLRLIYDSPGGVIGQLAEFMSAPLVSGNLRATMQALKRLVQSSRQA